MVLRILPYRVFIVIIYFEWVLLEVPNAGTRVETKPCECKFRALYELDSINVLVYIGFLAPPHRMSPI